MVCAGVVVIKIAVGVFKVFHVGVVIQAPASTAGAVAAGMAAGAVVGVAAGAVVGVLTYEMARKELLKGLDATREKTSKGIRIAIRAKGKTVAEWFAEQLDPGMLKFFPHDGDFKLI